MSETFDPSQNLEARAPEPLDPRVSAPVQAWNATAASDDRAFIAALRGAGLLAELFEDELGAALATVRGANPFARQLDLLEQLYGADGDAARCTRRILADGLFLHHADDAVNAHGIVQRLVGVAPELGAPSLERILNADGPLILRDGELVAPVSEYEDFLADNEELIEEGVVTVRNLVHAANVLRKRRGDERRWVLLRCDGAREAYCAVDVDGAIDLCTEGLIEELSVQRLVEFCAF